MTFHLSPFELSMAPVTVHDTGTGNMDGQLSARAVQR